MKKISVLLVSFVTLLSLTACGSSKDVASIVVEEGEYIIPNEDEADSGDDYLALKVKITNESDKSIDLAQSDFSLYDEDDNKISLEDFYMSDTGIETLSYEKISAGKSKTGYIMFPVEKDAQYQLHYEPTIFELDKELAPVTLDVDTSQFEDHSEESLKAVNAYIDEVFLATTNEDYNSLVVNDRDEMVTNFDNNFGKGIKRLFYYYKVTDEAAAALAKTFREDNGKVADVSYEVATFYPDMAEIAIVPTVIDFNELEDDIEKIQEDYAENHPDEKYESRYSNADKAVVKKLPELLEKTSPVELEGYRGAFQVTLKKKDDKWEIQTKSSYSSDYDSLEEAFRGNLYKG